METIVVLNIKEILEEVKFRKIIEALDTYESEDEMIEAMLAQKQRDLAEEGIDQAPGLGDAEDSPFDERPEE